MDDLPPLPPMDALQAMVFEAARRGDEAALGALIRAGVGLEAVDDRGHGALMLAAYHGHGGAVALLLDAGAAPDGVGAGNTSLMGVAFKGHLDVAALLLDRGADPDARGAAGRTALMTAALFNQPAIADLLLARGADPNAVDDAGDTASTLALTQGHADLAARLRR